MQPKNWRGKATHTNALERPRGPLYLSKRPTNARIWHKAVFKMGPVASGKAKNTFGPVGIPPQAPGNNPPDGGYKPGGWPPEAGGNLQCRGTPGRTAQRLDGLPNATQELERKGHTKRPRASAGTSVFIVASHQRTNMARGRF